MLVRLNPIIPTLIFLLFTFSFVYADEINIFHKEKRVQIGNAYIVEPRVEGTIPIEFPAKYINVEFGQGDVCLPATDYYVFDGSSYVEFQDKNFFNIENKDFSIEFWMKANPKQENEEVLLYRANFFVYLASEGRIGFILNDENFPSGSIETENLYKDDQWHHVVITISNGVIKIYVDGVQQLLSGVNGYEVNTGGPASKIPNEVKFSLGADTVDNARHFLGIIAKPRVWGSALTDEEIEIRYLQVPPIILQEANAAVESGTENVVAENEVFTTETSNISKFPSPFTSYIISSPTTIAYIPQFILGMIPEDKTDKK